MATYTIRDTTACWVTFTHTVDANTPADALAAYVDGVNVRSPRPEIGTALAVYPRKIEILKEHVR